MFSRGIARRCGEEVKAGVCLSLTHCNVSTFLSGSANLAASLSNFSWQQPRKNRRGKSTRAGALDDCRESAALVRAFFASPHSRSSSSFFFFFASVRFAFRRSLRTVYRSPLVKPEGSPREPERSVSTAFYRVYLSAPTRLNARRSVA